MLNEIQQLTLDTCRLQRSCKTVKQNDSATRFLSLRLTADGKPIDLSQAQAFVYCKKPDSTVAFSPAEITDPTDGAVSVELTQGMLAVPGEVCAEIRVYAQGGRLLSTLPFFLTVVEAVCNERAVESTDEYLALTQAINKVSEFSAVIGNADAAAAAAQEAARTASDAASRAEQAVNGFVPDGSVTPETMSWVRANLFDKSKAIEADIQTDGTALPAENYLCTDFITVRPDSTYTFPAGRRRHIALYNKAKEFLRYIDGGTSNLYDAPLTIPTDIPVAWLRISYFLEETALSFDNFMMCVGKKYYEEYLPFGTYAEGLYLSPSPRSIDAEKISGAWENLLDVTKLVYGGLDAATGALTSSAEKTFVSAPTAVEAGRVYSLNPRYPTVICFYGEDMSFISSTSSDKPKAPENAEFARVSVEEQSLSQFNCMLIKGEKYPDFYVPFGRVFVPWIENNPLTGKKLLVLGDSICAYHKCHINTAAYQNNMDFVRSGNNDGASDNQSVSGSPLARRGGAAGASFIERFEVLIGAGGAWENARPHYFVLDGGVNDCLLGLPLGQAAPENDFSCALDEYTACGALEKIFRLARSKWPDCFIGYFTSYDFPQLPNMPQYNKELKKVCEKYSVPVLDLYSAGNFRQGIEAQRARYMADSMHINGLGHLKFAPLFETFLKTGGAAFTAKY